MMKLRRLSGDGMGVERKSVWDGRGLKTASEHPSAADPESRDSNGASLGHLGPRNTGVSARPERQRLPACRHTWWCLMPDLIPWASCTGHMAAPRSRG